jgi:hypothetical protein
MFFAAFVISIVSTAERLDDCLFGDCSNAVSVRSC